MWSPVQELCSKAGQPRFERERPQPPERLWLRARPAWAWAAFRPAADQSTKRLCISASKWRRLRWRREKEPREHSARSRAYRGPEQSREDQLVDEVVWATDAEELLSDRHFNIAGA